MANRYYVGSLDTLRKVCDALDKLGGFPKATPMPSPPRPAVWYEGALGWTGHLLAEPHALGDGDGLLEFPEDDSYLEPLLGQAADVNGETVVVPPAEGLSLREQLDQKYRDYLDSLEVPPGGFPGGGDPGVP